MAGLLIIPAILGGAVAGSLLGIPLAVAPTAVQFAVSGGLIAVGCFAPCVSTRGGLENLLVQGAVASFFLVSGTILLFVSFGGLIALAIYGSPNAGEAAIGIIISFAMGCVLCPCLVHVCCWLDGLSESVSENQGILNEIQCEGAGTLDRHEDVTNNDENENDIEDGINDKSDNGINDKSDNELLQIKSNELPLGDAGLTAEVNLSQGSNESRSTPRSTNKNQDAVQQSTNSEHDSVELHKVGSGICSARNDNELR